MLRAAGRQIAKRHKKAQRPHGRQSVKKLMAHGENVNSIEVEAPKLFDRTDQEISTEFIQQALDFPGVDIRVEQLGEGWYFIIENWK